MVRCSFVRVFGCYHRFIQFALASFYAVHIHFVNALSIIIMKVYIQNKNMQFQLTTFRKKIDFIDFANLEVGNVFMKLGSLLSVTCRHHSE